MSKTDVAPWYKWTGWDGMKYRAPYGANNDSAQLNLKCRQNIVTSHKGVIATGCFMFTTSAKSPGI